jgi:predicted nucleotidyltransferase/biotin operon repressor
MKHMSHKRYTLDQLGSKVAINVMRCLFNDLHRYLSISDISQKLNTSRANVHRGIDRLDLVGIIRRSKSKGRSMVRIDSSSKIAKPFFILFNNERAMNVDIQVKDAIEQLMENINSDKIEAVILFGSQARGIATTKSDVDILIVTDDKKTTKDIRAKAKTFLPEIRMDLHPYTFTQFLSAEDLVLVDAKLYGISFNGDELLFEQRSSLNNIRTTYLKSRLRSVSDNLKRSRLAEKDARSYFLNVAYRTLSEISGVLSIKLRIDRSEDGIQKGMIKVKEELFRIGDRVWLN